MAPYLGSGYLNAMDRPEGEDIPSIGGFNPKHKPEALLSVSEIGVSIMATRDVIQPLTAKIREGARKVEIGFMGSGKGSIFSGQITPEGVDYETRRAIRELAKVNQVELSTHASVGVTGFAGLTNQGFNEQQREETLTELKRAIDFAAETAGGGAITVHTGEFRRSLAPLEKGKGIQFELFEGEATQIGKDGKPEYGKTFHLLADEETGRIIEGVQENIKLKVPVFEKVKDPNTGVEKDRTDIFGNPVPKWVEGDAKKKIPGQFETVELNWGDIEKRAREWERDHPGQKMSTEKMFFQLQNTSRLTQMEGERLSHLQDKEKYERLLRKLSANEEKVAKLGDMEDDERRESIARLKQAGIDIDENHLKESQNEAMQDLADTRKNAEYHLARISQSALAFQRQKEDLEEGFKKLKPVAEVALTKSFKTIAEAGLYAYEKEKKEGLSRNLFVAPENLFPEVYGAHPQELKNLILESRKKMAEMLEQRGMNKQEASKTAADHIRATFDIGHANMWRKYMDRKPGESLEAQDARFKEWLIGQVKELNKHNVIGHIHVTDNFGYHDEHLTPGMGNTPIVEFVKAMKEAGVTDLIVEPGAQDPAKQYEALYGGWKLFGHSIYGVAAPGKKALWEAVEGNYFGNTNPPRFLFGEMALSDQYRGRPFYTGLGLE